MVAPPVEDMQPVALILARLSNEEGTPDAFVHRACELLRDAMGARALSVWVKTGEQIARWSIAEGATTVSRDLISSMQRDIVAQVFAGERDPIGLIETALGDDDSADARRVRLALFDVDGSERGLLVVEGDEACGRELVKQRAVEEYAELLGVALSHRRSRSALAERVKELRCMYRIAQLGVHVETPLAKILQQIVELLPPAWQHPTRTHARLSYDGREFCSPGFATSLHRLQADIAVGSVVRGSIEVFTTSDESASRTGDGPFLAEEQQLIEGVAREVVSLIERRVAAEQHERLHEQIRHADRLATIGQLSAGVAHELNEPLGTILGFAQLALKGDTLSPQLRADLDRIVSSSLYAREIIRKLMFFARQTPARRSEVDLEEVVDDALSLLGPRCSGAGVAVHRTRAPDLPVVFGDRAQLQQVLVNLAVNAIQAMPSGGSMHVSTALDAQGWVRIAVEDEGVGISAENVSQLFVPFYTTKDVGEGTGLGLSVVHGIVAAHGGAIDVESKPGRGSRFEVRLASAELQRIHAEEVR